jgi:hypothetical protein
MRLIYNPNRNGAYGVWSCPSCGNRFYGGGEPIHRTGCVGAGHLEGTWFEFSPAAGSYAGLDYEFGPKEVEAAVRAAQTYSQVDMPGPLGPVSVELLRQHGYDHLINGVSKT